VVHNVIVERIAGDERQQLAIGEWSLLRECQCCKAANNEKKRGEAYELRFHRMTRRNMVILG